jgi:hypothetical protein
MNAQFSGAEPELAVREGFSYNRSTITTPYAVVKVLEDGVRTLLVVAVIAVGVLNMRLHHPWHRALGAVAVAVGLVLCAFVWFF